MLDGHNLGTLGLGSIDAAEKIILCGNFYLPHKNQRASFSANAFVT